MRILLVLAAAGLVGSGCSDSPMGGEPDGDGGGEVDGSGGEADGDSTSGEADGGDGEADVADVPEEMPFPSKISQTYYRLNRELIGIPKSNGGSPAVFLGWRSIPGDTDSTVFDIRRSASYLEGACAEYPSIATGAVNAYLDTTVGASSVYYYCIGIGDEVSNVVEVDTTTLVTRDATRLTLAFEGCSSGTQKQVTNAIVGDLNGDDLLDFAIGYCDFVGTNPNAYCRDQPVYVVGMLRRPTGGWEQAWCYDANFVQWKATTGWPMVVWDVDEDGSAEIITRTDDGANMTVLDGATGSVRSQIAFPMIAPDNGGQSRCYGAIAYLDGVNPYLVMQRGLYGGSYNQPHIFAYSFVDGVPTLAHEYLFNQDTSARAEARGTHGLPTADVDGDGIDKIIPCGSILELKDGALVLRGTFNAAHSDTCIVTDVRPDLDGLEIFFAEEGQGGRTGLADRDAALLWSQRAGDGLFEGVLVHYWSGWERGTCFYTGGTAGLVCQVAEFCDQGNALSCMGRQRLPTDQTASKWHRFSATGAELTANRRTGQTDWIVGEGIIDDGEELNAPVGVTLDGGEPGWVMADVFGDARAEVLTFSLGALWIYTNTAPITARYITQWADPNYFKTLAREGSGYYPTYKPTATRTFAVLCATSASGATGACAVASLADFEDSIAMSCSSLSGGEPCVLGTPDFSLSANSSVLTTISFPAAGRYRITARSASAGQVITKGVVLDVE